MRKTIQELAVEYGAVGVAVYLLIMFAVWAAFWAAISFGWKPSSTAATVGVVTASYIATKLTLPIRLAATIALTPFVARWYEGTIAPTLRRLYSRMARRPRATLPEPSAVRKPDSARSSANSTASPPADA